MGRSIISYRPSACRGRCWKSTWRTRCIFVVFWCTLHPRCFFCCTLHDRHEDVPTVSLPLPLLEKHMAYTLAPPLTFITGVPSLKLSVPAAASDVAWRPCVACSTLSVAPSR